MNLIVKTFEQLSSRELYEILRIRAEVFVVEQKCIYLDPDRMDYNSYHIFLQDETGIAAYLRACPLDENTARISRVLSTVRGKGLGREILQAGIRTVQERLNRNSIYVEAQVHAMDFYRKEGFEPISEEFIEDGIPRIKMILHL